MGVYDFVVQGRAVKYHGQNAVWQCHFPGHADGAHEESWSCTGYTDGRAYCFGCSKWASTVDLYVQFRYGIFVNPGSRGRYEDTQTRDAYREAFKALDHNSFLTNSSYTPPEEGGGRQFDELERTFLTVVADLMHRDLHEDQQAQQYLKGRGVFLALPNMGVARETQFAEIKDLARQLGDEELTVRVGLEGRKPKSRGRMHWMVADSTVVFQRNRLRQVVYYQARTLRTNRNKPYYCPGGVAKIPIAFGHHADGPWVGGEGWYKFAWAVDLGWNVWAPLGMQSRYVPTPYLAPLHQGLYIGDRNTNRAGLRGLAILQERAALSGYQVATSLVPRPFTDPDLWAAHIGYAHADQEMRSYLARFRQRFAA